MFARSNVATKADFSTCSGCSLCLLVCPVWRKTRDLRYTPHGRAKALQHGVPVTELAPSIESCTLCGACEPVCPENIDLVGMVLGLRRQLPPLIPVSIQTGRVTPAANYVSQCVLLAGKALRENHDACSSTLRLLGCTMAVDDGGDITLALEAGVTIPESRIEEFLTPLRAAVALVVADGLLARACKNWLPRINVTSLGVALSRRADLRRRLRVGDLYVIEPRAFHSDHARLIQHYDQLRIETGCAMNLDLQRIAIPATARNLRQRLGLETPDDSEQTRWILHQRKIQRIVVENVADISAFEQVCDLPVVPLAHLADLADDGKMKTGTLS